MRTLSIDIETYSNIDLMKSGVYKYAESPDFCILLFAYAFDNDPVTVIDLEQGEELPEDVVSALVDNQVLKTAYNAQFERVCIDKFFYLGDLSVTQWECTMVKSSMLGMPLGLDKVGKVLNLENQKMRSGKNLINYFSKPCKPTKRNDGRTRNLPHHDPEKWEEFKEYCRRDVEVEMAIRDKISFFEIPDAEQRMWYLDQQINDAGVQLNMDLVQNSIKMNDTYTDSLISEMKAITGIDNPNSITQLKKWITDTTGTDIESLSKNTIPDLIEQTPNQKVMRVLELRQELAKTSVKKYEAMDRAACKDDRVRGLLQFYGANRTGRWAGRLVQVQNLPKNKISDLDLARNTVLDGDLDLLELLYGNVPDTLSQLIRTAFVAPEGSRFIVADFSAIEARVIAWLAGETWRLDVFNSHGKIYEASASQMFRVPIEEIHKGSPLRQKGKVAELALGYAGGVGALIKMGALDMGIEEDELQDIVNTWRGANPKIVKLWRTIDRAAKKAVGEKVPVKISHDIVFYYRKGFLFIRLPSGRDLAYMRASLEDGEYGKELRYQGMDQESKKWKRIPTYGGKLTENCLAGDTLVLTNRGWIPIINVHTDDLLWDGDEWVSHDGVIQKGYQNTINLDGVKMTEDHLVLTESGWKNASSCQRYKRTKVKLPDGYKICGFRRQKVIMGDTLRLRERIYNACIRVPKRETEVLRVHEVQLSKASENDPQYVQASGLCGMALNDRSMQITITSSLGKLRRSWNQGLQKVAREFSKLLGRYGFFIQKRSEYREDKCRRRLCSRELHVGNFKEAESEQEKQSYCKQSSRKNDDSRIVGENRYRSNNVALSNKQQLPDRTLTRHSRCAEQVYDIVNSGPRNRFVVSGDSGPFIVHNCVQAIARDCLRETMLELQKAGYKIVMHVHDEVIIEAPYSDKNDMEIVLEIMSKPLSWAPGLPLKGDGYETLYYKKD